MKTLKYHSNSTSILDTTAAFNWNQNKKKKYGFSATHHPLLEQSRTWLCGNKLFTKNCWNQKNTLQKSGRPNLRQKNVTWNSSSSNGFKPTKFQEAFTRYITENKRNLWFCKLITWDKFMCKSSKASLGNILGNNWIYDWNLMSHFRCRLDVVLFVLWWVNCNKVRKWCGWSHLSFGIPVKHDLDLDAKHSLPGNHPNQISMTIREILQDDDIHESTSRTRQ